MPPGSGIIRWVWLNAANGPFSWRSWNRRPGWKSYISASHVPLSGPAILVRTVVRKPAVPNSPSCATTRVLSHGGVSRANASGRACHAYSSSADAGIGDFRTNV